MNFFVGRVINRKWVELIIVMPKWGYVSLELAELNKQAMWQYALTISNEPLSFQWTSNRVRCQPSVWAPHDDRTLNFWWHLQINNKITSMLLFWLFINLSCTIVNLFYRQNDILNELNFPAGHVLNLNCFWHFKFLGERLETPNCRCPLLYLIIPYSSKLI